MPDLRLTSEPDAPREDHAIIDEAINRHNIAATGIADWRPITLFLRDETGAIHGGLLGDIWGGVAHVSRLWIDESQRGQEYGSKLLAMAEDQAREKGCHLIYLDTFSFQAPEFYKRHGFEVFGVIENHPLGHTHYFLKKTL